VSARPGRAIRVGTRGSALALAQARLVADALASHQQAVEFVVIETAGDHRAPDTAWGEGAFVGAIEAALLDERIDLGIHSAKDLPTDSDPRLAIIAYLPRGEPRDALVLAAGSPLKALDDLPAGAIVGTDSPRRTAFLRAHRPDLDVRPLHGNVDTRLRRLDEGRADALLLAAAGLERLGRADRISQLLPVDIVPPAPGQGALAIQARAADSHAASLGRMIDDRPTRQVVEAERALLAATGGGCRAPIGALATLDRGHLRLHAAFATLDGRFTAAGRVAGSAIDGDALAASLAARLVAQRAARPDVPRVLLTRPAEPSLRLAGRLAEHGLAAAIVPAIEIEPLPENPDLAAALDRLADHDRVVVTSVNGAAAIAAVASARDVDLARGKFAAVGRATARALIGAGAEDVWLPSTATAAAIATELPIEPGARVILVRGDLADDRLPVALRDRAAEVREVVAYRTVEAPATSRELLAHELSSGNFAAVLLASPSAVRGLLALAGPEKAQVLLAVPAVCTGPSTAAAAHAAGFADITTAAAPDADTLAELVAETIARTGRPQQ
jgi:hydroxymethylbilane synthase